MKLSMMTPEEARLLAFRVTAAREAEGGEPFPEETLDAIVGWADSAQMNAALADAVYTGQLAIVGWEADGPVFRISAKGTDHVREMLTESGLEDTEEGLLRLIKQLETSPWRGRTGDRPGADKPETGTDG